MEKINPCCCCLFRPSVQDLKTPYVRFGITEIFSDMIQECFQINILLDDDDEYGICEVCASRLRDASDFKLQVQRSQAELQARLQARLQSAVQIKKEQPEVLIELFEDDGTNIDSMFRGEHLVKSEELYDARPSDEMLYEESSAKIEAPEEDGSSEETLRPGHGGAGAGALPGGSGIKYDQKQTCYCCNVCSREFASKVVFAKHQLTHTKKSYTCEICHKEFSAKFFLSQHSVIHTGHKPYSCEMCNKSFSLQGNLKRHLATHTGEKPHSCKICHKSFTEHGGLKKHIVTHTGERPFSCEICSKAFAHPSNLKMHIKIHTGEKRYSCEMCNKSFTQKSNLKGHVSRHHAGQ